MTSAILQECCARILTACDGVEAVEIYEKEWREIDVVLLDLTMPRMDGRECLRELRRINPAARVLLWSGYNELDALGLDEKTTFLHKPFQRAHFLATLQALLGR